MSSELCVCCRIPPKAGQRHPCSIEIKYGAMKGTHYLCEACRIEVSKAVARMVQSKHTFEVLKNAIINTYEKIERRRYSQRILAVPQSCRVDFRG
jgi:hypothetical protein